MAPALTTTAMAVAATKTKGTRKAMVTTTTHGNDNKGGSNDDGNDKGDGDDNNTNKDNNLNNDNNNGSNNNTETTHSWQRQLQSQQKSTSTARLP